MNIEVGTTIYQFIFEHKDFTSLENIKREVLTCINTERPSFCLLSRPDGQRIDNRYSDVSLYQEEIGTYIDNYSSVFLLEDSLDAAKKIYRSFLKKKLDQLGVNIVNNKRQIEILTQHVSEYIKTKQDFEENLDALDNWELEDIDKEDR